MPRLGFVLFAAFAYLLTVSANAQTWPQKALTIVVGFPAGGDTDTVSRIYADKLRARLGQPVIVENKPGASGMIGAAYVAKAPADGYTIMNVVPTFVLAPQVLRSSGLAYHVVDDFTPIFQVSKSPLVVVASPSLKLNSVADLVAEAKKNTTLSYGTPGIGSPMHLLAEHFLRLAGISMTHIPYKGNSQVISDSIAGHVTIGWAGPASANTQIDSGTLLALAVTSPERSPLVPNVPTFAEAGFPDVRFVSWNGFLGPKNMPQDVVQILNKHFNEITQLPEVRAKLAAIGLEPVGGPPELFAETVRQDFERFGAIIRENKDKLD